MAGEILRGLQAHPKWISPKYFYDAKGSELFEQITDLPEYYLTRTEMALFDEYLPDIAKHRHRAVCVVEYGSGSSLKIRKLLEALTPEAYVPVDISNEHLQENAQQLHTDFPRLHVYPVCADFTQQFELPDAVEHLSKLAFFPGSSIGNFEPAAAQDLLLNVRASVGEGGYLLIGVDCKKDQRVLEAAYDDAAGITAAFNLNVLTHLNQTLDADFDLANFTHVAQYNERAGCIQMFLQSLKHQLVRVAGAPVEFVEGERLHTENSYKYHPQEFLDLAAGAGFCEVQRYSDERDWFALYLLQGC
jgi:L-histidine Nalpha-methyltransferase